MSRLNNGNQITRRGFISRSVAGAALLCMSSSAFRDFEARADEEENDVVLRFSAFSDVHFKKSPEAREVDRFRRSMSFMYDYSAKQKYSNFDAMLVAGDFSDHGYDEELLLFKKILDEGIRPGTEPLLCIGNHEFYSGKEAHEVRRRWEEIFERPANSHAIVKGFHFIGLSPEKGSCGNGDYLYALDWYKNALAEAEADSPDKPIFTFQHYHVTPTVYGSRERDGWGVSDLFDVLQRYPRVVNFSGHSHYPINDPRSAWQGNFSAFGTGSLSYCSMGVENGKFVHYPQGYRDYFAPMYIVEVRRDNSVALKQYDLITNSFYDLVFYVARPGAIDTYAYADSRMINSVKPVWSENAAVSSDVVAEDAIVRLSFPQAQSPDVVVAYRVDLERQNGAAWEKYDSKFVWSDYFYRNQPKTMNVEIDSFPEKTSIRAKVAALNAWFAESETLLETDFIAPANPATPPDWDAPRPEANVLDVVFQDGKPVNRAKNWRGGEKKIEVFGAPKISENADFGGAQAATFNGVDERLKIKFNSRDYRLMKRASIAATFKIDEMPDGKNDVLASTEGGGVSIEINGAKKRLEFWASVNGKYEILGAPIEPGKAIDAFGTYDGTDLRFFMNGKLVDSRKVVGALNFPQEDAVQAFCVGSDVATGGAGALFLKGAVARARVFSWGLTPEQVANLSEKRE